MNIGDEAPVSLKPIHPLPKNPETGPFPTASLRVKMPQRPSMTNPPRRSIETFYLVWILLALAIPDAASAAKCLYVSSYHRGYEWSDGVERGVRSVLEGRCELRQFDMDTKRKKSPEEMAAAGLEAKQIIDSWQPDVVITADDNAAKYLIQPYFKDHTIPFVFCGINWTIEEYDFPYDNLTGMVEIAPIAPLLNKAIELLASHGRGIYIGANTRTETKNLARFENAAERIGVQLDAKLVDTVEDWINAYRDGQAYDFVIMGSNSGIADWNEKVVVESILPHTRRLSVTNHGWMMPYTMLGFTKIPEEQGEWAAKAAIAIMNGMAPSEIAIVPNRKWDIWTNAALLEAARIRLPESLIRKSKKFQ